MTVFIKNSTFCKSSHKACNCRETERRPQHCGRDRGK